MDSTSTYLNESQAKFERNKRIWDERKSKVSLFLYGLWSSFLWKMHLAKSYSRFMCRHGWYRTFPDGRCMYCGGYHKTTMKKARGDK